jgi:hypothetical protein
MDARLTLLQVAGGVVFGAIGGLAGCIGERLARRPSIGARLDRVAGREAGALRTR